MRSVFSISAVSQKAKDWLDKNIHSESWQWLGGSLVVEHRYIADIVAGMLEDGLKQHKDFCVS